MSVKDVAKAFLTHYYKIFDESPEKLNTLYTDQSMLTWEGTEFQGKENIHEKLIQLKGVKHQTKQFDAQPCPGNGALVFVIGNLMLEAGKPMAFTQVFTLMPTGSGSYFVLNDIFRLTILD